MSARTEDAAARRAAARRRRRRKNVEAWALSVPIGTLPAILPFVVGALLRWVIQPQQFTAQYRVGDAFFYVALFVWFVATIIARVVVEDSL